MSLILIYQMDPMEKQETLLSIAKDLDLEVKEISQGEVHQKVGALVGLEGYEKTDEKGDLSRAPESEMVLFANVERQKIYDTIDRLREEGYTIPHKAALTRTTQDWTFRMLVNHIEQENKTVRAYTRLISRVKKAEVLQVKVEDKELQKAIEAAYALRDLGEDLSERNIREVQVQLDEAMAKHV